MKKSLILMIGFLLINFQNIYAQCAMCRATVENNISDGASQVGAGLNAGILFLMSMPYILIASIAFVVYKKVQQNKLNTSIG
ncbi:hypothetical protein KMW28_09880 [Flammeovirga yaeyamensis]|uniref:Uncharacterized protein n=1 Tax=Flammeovirga yaeyamensis TaxID=367791 RepID=A0AAX1NCN8_9BACT|nr:MULTISPECIES: hypothetical protein [Flammeovirga]ANQ48653.2 hypothetical protein MY04_1276 [Flammeovirga sp. MY04]MBB3698734.1 hypothetical protein [Flammeovirga yaeyamensis]NMF37320.1 hypothetical protein [Flammeovirga yaeyamensis]QWG03862.1 hypothetical protein KMW28_09880 [Flammeovirga yaeyamensis]